MVRCPAGSRSSTGCRRGCGSSAMASAASSARIRASTAAISASLRSASSRVAWSSSSSSNTSASSSGSACTWPRISVSSSLDASSIRSAIWAGFSRRIRASGPRSPALLAWPISGSNRDQSRNTCSSCSPSSRRNRPSRPPGRRWASTPASTHSPSGCSRSSRSAARTRWAVSTSMSRWPSTSARSSTSPSRRSKRRRSSWALVSFSSLPSNRPVCSTGTNTSRPPTLATSPVTTGQLGDRAAGRSRPAPGPAISPLLSVIGRLSRSMRWMVRPPRVAAGGIRLCRGHTDQCFTAHQARRGGRVNSRSTKSEQNRAGCPPRFRVTAQSGVLSRGTAISRECTQRGEEVAAVLGDPSSTTPAITAPALGRVAGWCLVPSRPMPAGCPVLRPVP